MRNPVFESTDRENFGKKRSLWEHEKRLCQSATARNQTLRGCTTGTRGWQLSLNKVLDETTSLTRLASILRSCGRSKAISDGRRVHAYIWTCGLDCNTFMANCLVDMYGNFGSINDARAVFDKILKPNLYSWNILIKALGQNGIIQDACYVFNRMPQKDIISWNAMIAVLAENGHDKEAVNLFYRMQGEGFEPNEITCLCTIDACSSMADLEKGREIHAAVVDVEFEQDVLVGTSLVSMYGKCGCLHDAKSAFSRISDRDVAAWNAIICAFAQNGKGKEALLSFQQMQLEGVKPDEVSFVGSIEACANLAALEEGHTIHAAIISSRYEQDVFLGNTLLSMYGKCGSLLDAVYIFERMPYRNLVSWNGMIAVFAQNMIGKEALDFFYQMQLEGVKPDEITFMCALDACASLAALEEGQDIHVAFVNSGCMDDIAVKNALINMYGKCGSLYEARMIFDGMRFRDVVSWSAMIAGYTQNGHNTEALYCFNSMQFEGLKADKVTFLSVLMACGRAGWVDEGRHLFVSMKRDHGIPYSGDHYICMIDLLGRAGKMDEAEDLIQNMPCEKVGMAWLCLLSACTIHCDIDRGARSVENCFKLNPGNVAPYVMLSNMFAAAGKVTHRNKCEEVF